MSSLLTASQLLQIENIMRQAGDLIEEEAKSLISHKKADDSPVTSADLKANAFFFQELPKIASFPLVSEESGLFPQLEAGETFWLLDPLDGTKHFIQGDGEYAVCLALVASGSPVAGFIFGPSSKQYYSAVKGQGAFKNGEPISNTRVNPSLRAFSSGYHEKPHGQKFMKQMGITEVTRLGSALKFCLLAEGLADIYPRFGETYEWDTAAGQIIFEEAGGLVLDLQTKTPLKYQKPQFLNRGFIACRKNILSKII